MYMYYTCAISISPSTVHVVREMGDEAAERALLSVLGSSGTDRTVCLFDRHVCWQPSPSLGIQFQSVSAFQCTQKDGEEKAVMMDY